MKIQSVSFIPSNTIGNQLFIDKAEGDYNLLVSLLNSEIRSRTRQKLSYFFVCESPEFGKWYRFSITKEEAKIAKKHYPDYLEEH